MKKLFGLIKVGKREYLEDLRDGKVYCNTLKFFSQTEKEDKAIGMIDRFEGGHEVNQWRTLSCWNGDEYIPIMKNIIAVGKSGLYNGNVYCAYHLEIPLDKVVQYGDYFCGNIGDVSKFGDSFVIIENIDEFAKRLEKAVNDKGNSLKHGPVDYLDYKNFSGKITPFNKDVVYAGQKEYRFYIERNASSVNDAVTYFLGDLSDITSEVIDSSSLYSLKYSKY